MRSNGYGICHGGGVKIMAAVLIIAVTDASGSQRRFEANRVSLDCGCGSLEFQAGCPTYCRKFDNAVMNISHTTGDTVLHLHNGTASLTAGALNILCEVCRCREDN
jgi:hypothetical protein